MMPDPSLRPKLWRRALALDLGLFNAAVVALALIPPSQVRGGEWLSVVLGIVLLCGILTHASERVRLPGDEWAYLATGALGLWSFFNFELTSAGVPGVFQTSVGLFLLSGAASGYAAHVIDGGRPKHGRA